MSLEFSIRVVDDEGDPVSGRRVLVFGKGAFGVGSHTEELTGKDGWAEFILDGFDDDETWEIHEIYIGPELVFEGYETVEDGDTYSFTDPI